MNKNLRTLFAMECKWKSAADVRYCPGERWPPPVNVVRNRCSLGNEYFGLLAQCESFSADLPNASGLCFSSSSFIAVHTAGDFSRRYSQASGTTALRNAPKVRKWFESLHFSASRCQAYSQASEGDDTLFPSCRRCFEF